MTVIIVAKQNSERGHYGGSAQALKGCRGTSVGAWSRPASHLGGKTAQTTHPNFRWQQTPSLAGQLLMLGDRIGLFYSAEKITDRVGTMV